MGNVLTKFEKEFEGMEVEIIQGENGEPLFEIYSTGAALGYTKLVKSKGKEYSQIRKDRIEAVVKNGSITGLPLGGKTYLTEEMLYDFMFEAKTVKCKAFRKWVTSDVLPSIRKTGGYVAPGIAGKDNYTLDLAKSMQLTNQVVQGILSSMTRMEEFVKDSLNSKDIQIDKTAEMIGLRAKNPMVLAATLKEKLERLTGNYVSATSTLYKKVRHSIFKEFRVTKWEDVAIGNFNRVHAFIDSIDEV